MESTHRIAKRFAARAAERQPALVAYLTAGDPKPAMTARYVAALERGGADIIELGVPFSDPIADGPVIQAASDRALRAGTTVAHVLDIAREIRKTSEIPLILFSYLNPLLRYGLEKLARDARAAGIDGILVTDLSVEEAAQPVRSLREAGLDTIFLAAPTSTERRLCLVAEYSTGFVYAVSRTGVTGERSTMAASAETLCSKLHALTAKPVAVGFGISSHEHVAAVFAYAAGAVIGSAIVRIVSEGGDVEKRLESYMRELRGGAV